jgi:hypothetical protein
MVFGSILNWAVGRTLDFTFDTIWWITKSTGQGIYNAGYYLVISREKNSITKDDLVLSNLDGIKEQNELLKQEIILLRKLVPEGKEL